MGALINDEHNLYFLIVFHEHNSFIFGDAGDSLPSDSLAKFAQQARVCLTSEPFYKKEIHLFAIL